MMARATKTRLGYGLALALPLAVFAGASDAQAQEAPKKGAEQVCVVTLDPATIPVQQEQVLLRARFSTAIGEKLSALIEEASGVKVVAVEGPAPQAAEAGPDAPPVIVANVRLDASQAAAGEWTISFEGEQGKCTGKLAVERGEPESR